MKKRLNKPDFLGKDLLTEAIRNAVRDKIKEIVVEELQAFLGAGPYERTGNRKGYRHGFETRGFSTSLGKTELLLPRGRVFQPEGSTREWQSQIIPRYKRRMKKVDDAILGLYLGGVNTRRIKRVLRPLLKETNLSKSTISRMTLRLKEKFEKWEKRKLDEESVVYLYLDGFWVSVRCAGRVSKSTVLAAVGVRENGEKTLLGLWLRGSESTVSWEGVLENLVFRGLRRPKLVIIDGNQALRTAIQITWPGIDIQRCIVHKLRNLFSHAPKYAYKEIKEDFYAIVYAESLEEAKKSRERFLKKWKTRCEGVTKSLLEAKEEILTFFSYPKTQWKSLRTTNIIERMYVEFRRRIKTQTSLPSEGAVLSLLYGLFASGQIRMNRIQGYKDMPKVIGKPLDKAA